MNDLETSLDELTNSTVSLVDCGVMQSCHIRMSIHANGSKATVQVRGTQLIGGKKVTNALLMGTDKTPIVRTVAIGERYTANIAQALNLAVDDVNCAIYECFPELTD